MGIQKREITKLATRAQKRAKRLANRRERARQVKRDILARELAIGEINRKKIAEEYSTYTNAIKNAENKYEFEAIISGLDRILDIKDYEINLLMCELNETETQAQVNLKSHWYTMDKMFNDCLAHLEDLRHNYTEDIMSLFKAVLKEGHGYRIQLKDNEYYMKLMQFGQKRSMRNVMDEHICEITRISEEVQRKRQAHVTVTLNRIDRVAKKYWHMLVAELTKYQSSIQGKKKMYDIYFAEDSAYQNEMNRKQNLLFRLTVIYGKLNDLFKDEKSNGERRILCYQQEYNYIKELKIKIQEQCGKSKKIDHKQIALLVEESNRTLEFLREKRKRVAKILRWYSLVRKYETLEEKTLPNPKYLPEDISSVTRDQQFCDEFLNKHAFKKYIFRSFINKIAQGDMTRYCLYEERKFLSENNEEIKKAIEIQSYGCSVGI